jgi:Undecaprenyl-phosphate glucose phosphotransferase
MVSNVGAGLGQGQFVGKPMPFRLNWEWIAVGFDLLVVWDFLAMIVSACIGDSLYRQTIAAAGYDGFWRPFGTVVAAGAVLAPLALRDDEFKLNAMTSRSRGLVSRLAKRFALLAGALLVVSFATRQTDNLPRSWFVFWIAAGFVLVLSGRMMLSSQVQLLQRKGILRERVAIVGAGPLADRLIGYLTKARPLGIEIVGVYDDRELSRLPAGSTAPKGNLADLVETGKRHPIDWVLVTLPGSAEKRLQSIARWIQQLATTVALCPEHVGTDMPALTRRFVDDKLAVTILADRPLQHRWDRVFKLLEDYILAGLATLLLSPVMALVALAVKLDSPGPVLFRQHRHGWNNGEFSVLKFRTMRHRPDDNGGVLRQTARGDERVTPLGRFLRRTSLDELPQLFNVLRGEMSLVGPRPHAVNMRTQERYGHEIIDVYAHRHRVKPGITGWAQVHGFRGATDTQEQLRQRVEHDLYYIEHWSPVLDFRILVMTVFNVLSGRNAY